MKAYWIIKYFSKDYSTVIAESYYDTKKKALKRNGVDANSRIISMHKCITEICGNTVCKCYLDEEV